MRVAKINFRTNALSALAGFCLVALSCSPRISLDQVLAGYRPNATYPEVLLRYPPDGVVFPPEIAPPAVLWEDKGAADRWAVLIDFPDAAGRLSFLAEKASWTPGP